MTSPPPGLSLSSPVLEQWRSGGGEHLTYSEVAWTGAACALIMHASLHFFSAALTGLERFLVVFAPAERLAFGLTDGANPLGTWLLLLVAVGVWGALAGVAILAAVREVVSLARRILA